MNVNRQETSFQDKNNRQGIEMDFNAKMAATLALIAVTGCADKSEVNARFSDFEERISRMEQTDIALNADKSAFLTPGSTGYSVVRSNFGFITVSVSNIKPYANGSKVALRFGNLMAADIDRVSGSIQWGTMRQDGVPHWGGAKSKQFEIGALPASKWTTTSVILDGVPTEELGFIVVSEVGHHGLTLAR